MYRCPNSRCGREISDADRVCPNCGLDLSPLVRLAELASYYYNDALQLADGGKKGPASERLAAVLALNPNDTGAHLLLGWLCAEEGKFDLAADHWKKVLQLDPGNQKAAQYLEQLEKTREEPVKGSDSGPREEGARRKKSWLPGLAAAVVIAGIVMTSGLLLRNGPEGAGDVEKRVRQALTESQTVSGMRIEIRALPERRISLEGSVPSALHGEMARTIAAGSARGWEVVDKLEIKPVDDLREKVGRSIRDRPGLAGSDLAVVQKGGQVLLSGKALTLRQVRLAEESARAVKGVEAVDTGGIEVLLAEPSVYSYQVGHGDTLWGLAGKIYGNPHRWKDIAAANGIPEEGGIAAGRVLIIPAGQYGSR